MQRTFHPESDIVASRREAGSFVYTLKDGRTVTVSESAFAGVTPGILGQPQRRAILARAVQEAK